MMWLYVKLWRCKNNEIPLNILYQYKRGWMTRLDRCRWFRVRPAIANVITQLTRKDEISHAFCQFKACVLACNLLCISHVRAITRLFKCNLWIASIAFSYAAVLSLYIASIWKCVFLQTIFLHIIFDTLVQISNEPIYERPLNNTLSSLNFIDACCDKYI